MENVKDAEVVDAVPVEAEKVEESGPTPFIAGKVEIIMRPDGALQVNAPQNTAMALAIIKAGETYIQMQMQDGMRRAQALRPPAIVKASTLDGLRRPS